MGSGGCWLQPRFDPRQAPVQGKRPRLRRWEPGASGAYNSTASISATKRPLSPARNAATTLNTASLKPPTFRMSVRSGAWVVAVGWRSTQTSLGPANPGRAAAPGPATNCCHSVTTAVEPLSAGADPALVVADQYAARQLAASLCWPPPAAGHSSCRRHRSAARRWARLRIVSPGSRRAS